MAAMTWTGEELDKIAKADEMEVAPMRDDGSPRKATTVWVVRDGDDIYVRAVRGTDGVWYRAAQATHRGEIRSGGVKKDITFTEETDEARMSSIDRAYRSKYSKYSAKFLDPVVSPQARAATFKLLPRSTH